MEDLRTQLYIEGKTRTEIDVCNELVKNRTYSLIKHSKKKTGYLSIPQSIIDLYNADTKFKLIIQEDRSLVFTPIE